ncbi:hypothetical protein B0T16DRAFT_148495 [Cercophora newfieldiana]|uniref:Uncharacterized protein n=1 Tax=Cercophora newfieldiana TaxID=92897 RepID=A0AA39Y4H6_9PEZI|nr:hypothetical protein B0T16DRAFT_148495 [Cercophora newfieldiana]
MNHFNATVKDGKLVSTRRGLQVSRQKFNGLSFVNSCPQASTDCAQTLHTSNPTASSSGNRTIKFVDNDDEPRQRCRTGRQTGGHLDTGFTLALPERRKQRRKPALKDHSSGESSRSSSRTPSSSSGESSTSSLTPFVRYEGRPFNAHDFTVRYPVSIPTRLGYGKPADLSDENWRLFHVYWEHVPRRIYPYEDIMTHNPARTADFYWVMLDHGNSSAIHCVLMSGSITQAVFKAEDGQKGYSYHISRMCAILNRALDEGKPVDAVTLGSISTLAQNGCYVGRLGDWWMHILGLRQILDLRDNVDLSHPVTGSQLHKADLKGAMALAINPLLPFTKTFPLASVILPSTIRSYITSSLSSLLSPLVPHSSPVINTITSLCLFVACVRLAYQSGGAVWYDPHAFTDEWLSITYDLLAKPSPLRESTVGENPYVGGRTGDTPIIRTADHYMANQRLRKDAHIIPAPGTHDWEAALRIAGLLYLKELIPDLPQNLGGYAVLLVLLRHHLEAIIQDMALDVDVNIDPALVTGDADSEISAVCRVDARAQRKAVLVFLCVVGNTVSLIANENEGRYEKGDVYERGVYQRGLRLALGVDGEGGNPPARNEGDLLLLKVLDMRNIKEEKWDDRVAVEELLVEGL